MADTLPTRLTATTRTISAGPDVELPVPRERRRAHARGGSALAHGVEAAVEAAKIGSDESWDAFWIFADRPEVVRVLIFCHASSGRVV